MNTPFEQKTSPLAQVIDNILNERLDDIPLLIGQMIKMNLPQIIDSFIPAGHNQRDLSWGWTTTVWLAYILSEGDHRKVAVQTYVEEMQASLSALTGQAINPLDFDDNRLTHLLTHLSKNVIWHNIEDTLSKHTIEVFELPTEIIRCDATTVSGFHAVSDESQMQFGHSKDDPNCPQIKMMTGALDPMGMPLATDVVSGENADDKLYIPIIKRIADSLKKTNLLYVGDSKMGALNTRRFIAQQHDFYLMPLALVGETAKLMPVWIEDGVARKTQGTLENVYRENEKGESILIAQGYELEREITLEDNENTYKERVFIIYSPVYAEKQSHGLEQRIATAIKKIEALTPKIGRGKRQIRDEESLQLAINKILTEQGLEGELDVQFIKEKNVETKYVGKGRGSNNRKQKTIETIRYQITHIQRNEAEIEKLKQRFGWKCFATNTPQERLSLIEAVLCYRKEYRVERIFNRLKNKLNIAPYFVQKDDQITGMSHLLMLGVRVLSLIEFVVRRSLQQEDAALPHLHLENKKKVTKVPTAERLLKAFSHITLTRILDDAGNIVSKFLTPLSDVQKEILRHLGLDVDIYHRLTN